MNAHTKQIYRYLLQDRGVPIAQIVTYCTMGWAGGFRYTIASYAHQGRER